MESLCELNWSDYYYYYYLLLLLFCDFICRCGCVRGVGVGESVCESVSVPHTQEKHPLSSCLEKWENKTVNWVM